MSKIKINYISGGNSWNDKKVFEEAKKNKNIILNRIHSLDFNDKINGEAVIWRSSKLGASIKRNIFIDKIITDNKDITFFNKALLDFPFVTQKLFQQEYIKNHSSKLPVIETYTCATKKDLEKLVENKVLKFPFITKPNLGSKGVGVDLIKSKKDLTQFDNITIKKNVFQNFIENDGDYRIIVIGGKPVDVIKRTGVDGSFLNNISTGGKASLVDEKKKETLFRISSRIAAIFNLSFCGVDIIEDKNNGKLYFLEVNTAPQWGEEGFQKVTGKNVAKILLDTIVDITKRKKKVGDENLFVEKYYFDNIFMLSSKSRFHFLGRMYLWTQEEKYLKLLKKEEFKDRFTENLFEEKIENIYNDSLIKESENKERVYSTKRQEIMGKKYPKMKLYTALLFKWLMSKTIYDKDYTKIIEKYISNTDLIKIKDKLLKNPNDIRNLSTLAINFLFLSDYYSKDIKLELKDITNSVPLNEKFINETDIKKINLNLYLITHAIIAKTAFYHKPIPKKDFKGYLDMLKVSEKMIEKNYFTVHLDIKNEFLTCSKILKYKSHLENRIYSESSTSFSDLGNFIIDKHNYWEGSTKPTDFIRSEHRNVLFVMSNLDWKKNKK